MSLKILKDEMRSSGYILSAGDDLSVDDVKAFVVYANFVLNLRKDEALNALAFRPDTLILGEGPAVPEEPEEPKEPREPITVKEPATENLAVDTADALDSDTAGHEGDYQ